MSALGATLRIARRDALRSKGRSALVVAMIALPVLGVGAADVLWRTFQLSPEQKASRAMGAAAAELSDTGQASIEQQTGGGYSGGSQARVGPAPTPTSLLPAGSRVLSQRGRDTSYTAGEVTTNLSVRDLPYTDPLTRGMMRQLDGRPPQAVGEVVLTEALAARLSVRIGDDVSQAVAPRRLRVVGLVEDSSRTDALTAVVLPGSLGPDSLGPESIVGPLLVAVPRPLTWADVTRANASGFVLSPRGHLPGEPPAQVRGGSGAPVTAAALIVGMVLLEIVLLAGPAFAVGAKRQSRELALLAATGGERRDIRRTVLGSGLVLGAVGGVLGVGAGIALAAAALPQLRDYSGSRPGPFDLHAPELLGLALVGVLTAVLAALLPARSAARQDVVAALTGRRGQVRSLKRTPLIGAVAAVAGAALALHGAKERNVNVILAGSALAELGLVATTPFLVGLVGRLGPWLPLAPRMALRDAARNRGRTAPAVSAVLAAVAGSVAIGTYVASLDRYGEQAYAREAPAGSLVVTLLSDDEARRLTVAAAVRRSLADFDVHAIHTVGAFSATGVELASANLVVVPKNTCGFGRTFEAQPSRAQLEAAAKDPLCNGRSLTSRFRDALMVGGPAELKAVAGLSGPSYDEVFAKGGAVVPFVSLSDQGTATITVRTPGRAGPGRQVVVPAVAAPRDQLQVSVLSPAAASRVGLPTQLAGVIATRDEVPTTREQDRVQQVAVALGGHPDVYVERGYQSKYRLGLLALLLGSAVIVLGASGIATGLAAADSRSDLATLAAVGASPSTRRRLAAFQSAVTAGLGTLLGVLAGLVPAVGIVRALNTAAREGSFPRFDPYPLVLPWTNLAITVLVVPLIAAGAAALLTRSRLPLVSRIT